MKKCVGCHIDIKTTIKTRNKKYCDKCRIESLRIQKRDWKRKLVGRYGNDLKCLDCNVFLGELKNDRKYCDNCIGIRVRKQKHLYYLNRKNKSKLLN